MSRQPFFIVGAPRSGTTMLQLALGRHSRVAAPPETHFFTLTSRSRRGQRRHWEGLTRKLGISLDPPPRRIRPGGEACEQFWRIAEAYLEQWGHRIELHFLPTYAPETNPIERVWWHLHETITRNHQCTTIDELLQEVYDWFATEQFFPIETALYRLAA